MDDNNNNIFEMLDSVWKFFLVSKSNASFLVAIHIENDQVSIEQLGANSSFVNQKPLQRHVRQSVHDGDQLHLLENDRATLNMIRRSLPKSSEAIGKIALESFVASSKLVPGGKKGCVSP